MSAQPRQIFLKDYTPPSHKIDWVDLTFEIAPGQTKVNSRMLVRALGSAHDLRLYGEGLELTRLQMDGSDFQDYTTDEEGLILHNLPHTFTLEIDTLIHPESNTALEGLYKSRLIYCTQCEPHGFRKITYFPDRPDVMTLFKTKIIADPKTCPVLLSNGNKIESGSLPDGRHFATWKDPFKKPSYLFALVAGDLACAKDSYTTLTGRQIALELWVEAKDLDKTQHALNSLKQAMLWDEQTYGLEYDLDIYMIVAVDDFNMGAMENKGLNIFNSSAVLASPETATDHDYTQIQGIVAHEYFHNWTGNRVTCRDWFQLSLKEGLTIYRDQTFSQDLHSEAVFRIEDVKLLRAHQFPEDAGPMAHAVRPESFIEINNFYTMTVYNKGAELIRMMQQYMGQDTFRKAMDLYFARHDGQAVTTEDFANAMEDAGHLDLTQFKRWYSQAGTPEVTAVESWEPETGRYTLNLSQHTPATPGQPTKEPFEIPIKLGLLGPHGQDLPLTLEGESQPGPFTRILKLTKPKERFVFTGLAAKPVPSLLRGFSAPVKLKLNQSVAEMAFLMAHDSDSFNRWEASQNLMIHSALELVHQFKAGQDPKLPAELLESLRIVLEDPTLDPDLAALMLQLPSESYLGEQMDVVEVEAIHQAREFLRFSLAQELNPLLQGRFDQYQDLGPYTFESPQAGQRALKNICLYFLTDEANAAATLEHFRTATNMTDSMAALSSLMDVPCLERELALEGFAQQWQHNALVMNNWFALQAGSCLTGVAEIQALMDHPAFDRSNPNKLRSLIGVFCGRNQSGFHQADGSGYRFLADQLLILDQKNPQIAARLFTPFTRSKKLDAQRRQLMYNEVERLMKSQKLSKNLFEFVQKTFETWN